MDHQQVLVVYAFLSSPHGDTEMAVTALRANATQDEIHQAVKYLKNQLGYDAEKVADFRYVFNYDFSKCDIPANQEKTSAQAILETAEQCGWSVQKEANDGYTFFAKPHFGEPFSFFIEKAKVQDAEIFKQEILSELALYSTQSYLAEHLNAKNAPDFESIISAADDIQNFVTLFAAHLKK